MAVDALGNPLRIILTGGQRNDITQAKALIMDFRAAAVLADKGYDADEFVEQVETTGALSVIPPRSNRKVLREYDKILYKDRHLVECCFCKFKYYRSIFSRFCKRADHFLAFILFAATLIWLR